MGHQGGGIPEAPGGTKGGLGESWGVLGGSLLPYSLGHPPVEDSITRAPHGTEFRPQSRYVSCNYQNHLCCRLPRISI